MRKAVKKYGGSSLCDAARISGAAKLIMSGGDAVAVVVSAPGKRNATDKKITDLLYGIVKDPDDKETLLAVTERFDGIVRDLGIGIDFSDEYEKLLAAAKRGDAAYTASRGEFFSAKIMAKLIGAPFVDASEAIRFYKSGKPDLISTFRLVRDAVSGGPVVIPGFYGTDERGRTVTFPRGGSDITGSIVASAVGADVYENFTDVPGYLFVDPKYGKKEITIGRMTYAQARFLSRHGARVMHEGALGYVEKTHTPIVVKSTFEPEKSGTLISGADGACGVYGLTGEKDAFGIGDAALAVGCGVESREAAFSAAASLGNGVVLRSVEESGVIFQVANERLDGAICALCDMLG